MRLLKNILGEQFLTSLKETDTVFPLHVSSFDAEFFCCVCDLFVVSPRPPSFCSEPLMRVCWRVG